MNTLESLLAHMHNAQLAEIELGLTRVERFLSLLGNPHLRLPPVIHVAGTNGKGSLLAYLDAIFKAAGLRVHRYTSPHLVRFNERIQLAGQPIDDAYLTELLSRVAGMVQSHPVTFFESTTAAAFLAFSEVAADVVLLETGLGGRLDATNVVPDPVLTAITPIAFDHMEFLGDTLESIAGEKAGILKAGVACVVGRQDVKALAVIEHTARRRNVSLSVLGRDWRVDSSLRPSMAGAHQLDNASTAAACIAMLPQFGITRQQIEQGITNAFWPARMQHITGGALLRHVPPGAELWLDGGHNAQGGQVLADCLKERAQGREVTLICGMIQGKDTQAYLSALAPVASRVIAIAIEGEAKSKTAAEVALAAQGLGMAALEARSIENALQTAAQHARTPSITAQGAARSEGANTYCVGGSIPRSFACEGYIICICGSLYLAGKVLALNQS
jgi:dihydrofolate synthase/folylpolyglutamate synthase